MKAHLDVTGVELISETESEKQMLEAIWINQPALACFGKEPENNVSLSIEPKKHPEDLPEKSKEV